MPGADTEPAGSRLVRALLTWWARSGPAVTIVLAFWTLFGVVCAAAGYWQVRTHGHSAVRLFACELVTWYAWAAVTPVVVWLGRRAPLVPFSLRASLVHLAVAVLGGVLHSAWWMAVHVWMQPYDQMGLQEFDPGRVLDVDKLFLEATIYFAVLGVTYAVDYQRRLRERELRAAPARDVAGPGEAACARAAAPAALPVQHAERDRRAGARRPRPRGGRDDRRPVRPAALLARPRRRAAACRSDEELGDRCAATSRSSACASRTG